MSVHIVDLNGTSVSVIYAKEKDSYAYIKKETFSTIPEEAIYFICKSGDNFISCIDDTENKYPICKVSSQTIYDNFKMNKFNLPIDKLMSHLVNYYILRNYASFPPNFDSKFSIKTINFKSKSWLDGSRLKEVWKKADFTGVTEKEYLDLMKNACKAVSKNMRIYVFKNIQKDFTDAKIQKQFLTFVKSFGDSKLYLEYYKKYNTVTDKELFKVYIEQELCVDAWNLYFKLPLNLQKLYHPEIIKLIPWFIGKVKIETIKAIEEIELIEWYLYDDAPLKPEYSLKGGILPYVSDDNKLDYVLDKIKVINNKDWAKNYLINMITKKGITPEFLEISKKIYEKLPKE
jgi:hypothetical protein